MKLRDVVNNNLDVTNVYADVSTNKVFFGKLDWMSKESVETVCCRVHGAMNKVSKDGLWRCLECGVSAKEMELNKK